MAEEQKEENGQDLEGARPESGKTDKPKAGKAKVKKEKADKPKGKYVGKELKIKLPESGTEIEGLCLAERKINGGEQVFLKVKGQGQASRFFDVSNIVE